MTDFKLKIFHSFKVVAVTYPEVGIFYIIIFTQQFIKLYADLIVKYGHDIISEVIIDFMFNFRSLLLYKYRKIGMIAL